MRVKIKSSPILLIIAMLLFNISYSQNYEYYHGCGNLVDTSGCLLYKAIGQDQYLLELENYGPFQAGDTVCIGGMLDLNYSGSCLEAMGYVYNNSIFPMYGANFLIIEILEGTDINIVIEEYQGYVEDSIFNTNIFLAFFPEEFPIDMVMQALENNPNVNYVHPDYILGLPETFQMSQQFPDDDHPPLLDGQSPPQYYSDSGSYSINIDSANLIATGQNIVVAVIDNGIDFGHPLFENSFSSNGYDLIDDDLFPQEDSGSIYGHGTFVSGVIKRVAPDIKLLPIRAFDEDGYSTSFNVAEAIYLAINNSGNVKIINMSFGSYNDIQIIREAVAAATGAGISLVSSPGNSNSTDPTYPSAYPAVISVSALDTLDFRADFSNYGSYLDVCAPGVNVYSSLAGEYDWGSWSGTSFSAPMATGICALLTEIKPNILPDESEITLRESADQELLWGSIEIPNDEYGYGCINAFQALLYWKRGDADNTNEIDILDINYLISFLYINGPEPIPVVSTGDFNCSGDINILDITSLIEYLYLNGSRPQCCE